MSNALRWLRHSCLRRLSTGIVLLTVTGCSHKPQEPTVTIQAVIRDAKRRPIAGALLDVRDASGRRLEWNGTGPHTLLVPLSNPVGRIKDYVPSLGTYTIEASALKYKPSSKVVVIGRGSPPIEFILEKLHPSALSPGKSKTNPPAVAPPP